MTAVKLSEAILSAASAAAKRRGMSVDEYIEQALAAALGMDAGPVDEDAWERSWEVVGAFHSGKPDLARRHDDYFAETAMDR